MEPERVDKIDKILDNISDEWHNYKWFPPVIVVVKCLIYCLEIWQEFMCISRSSEDIIWIRYWNVENYLSLGILNVEYIPEWCLKKKRKKNSYGKNNFICTSNTTSCRREARQRGWRQPRASFGGARCKPRTSSTSKVIKVLRISSTRKETKLPVAFQGIA